MHLKYQRKKFTHTERDKHTRTGTHTRIQKHIQTHIQISTCRHTLSTFGKLARNIQLTPAVSFFLSLFLSHSLILPHHPLSHFLAPPLPFTSLSAPLLSRHLPIQCLPPHTVSTLLPLLATLCLSLLPSLSSYVLHALRLL